MNEKIKLIIGLGNTGNKYKNTYHNAGHLFVDYLITNFPTQKHKFIKSDVFMNESGYFVKKYIEKIMKFTNLKTEEILFIHDDSDLNMGDSKFSFGRGSAGHKGVESIIKILGKKNFWRLRIGIRPKTNPLSLKLRRARAGEFVLKKISAADKKILEKVFDEAARELFGN